jgi:cytosine/adenosine deaminase-related metal-dependent hydrolase
VAKQRLVIEGASVVTLDPELGDFREGDILVEDDAIVAVGPNLGVSDAETIDGRGQSAIPGFAAGKREHGGILPQPRIELGL